MNKATATMTILDSKRAIVDISYTFTDGREPHEGFSTVEFQKGNKGKYDQGYNRAEALAKDQGCRLERFVMKKVTPTVPQFKVFFTNLNKFDETPFPTMDEAIAYVKERLLEAVIYTSSISVATFNPQSGLKLN